MIQDAISVVPMFQDSLQMFVNLVNFVRDSPKHVQIFEHLKDARCQIDKAFLSHKMVLRECSLT